MATKVFVSLLASGAIRTALAAYQQVSDFSGDTFFDGFNFFTGEDPTSGFVKFEDQLTATSAGLIKSQFLNGSTSKQVYMGVDHSNITPNGRPSVRIESKQTYTHGLVLGDFAHAPGGICGTWPAFWMLGADPWPANGEIDIVEGVNDQTANAMTLHTLPGVFIQNQTTFDGSILGTVESVDCDVNAPNQSQNQGCTIRDDSDLSFGEGFNQIQGGVYATEWTSSFIKIWFFPRDKIPADVQAGQPVPSDSWGKPSSMFSGTYDLDTYFKDLKIVFDTTFCGSFAGAVFSTSPTCAAKAATCNDFVQNNPTAFTDAYWLINYVKVYQDDSNFTTPTTTTLPTPSASSSSSLSSLNTTSTPTISSNSVYTPPITAPGMIMPSNLPFTAPGIMMPPSLPPPSSSGPESPSQTPSSSAPPIIPTPALPITVQATMTITITATAPTLSSSSTTPPQGVITSVANTPAQQDQTRTQNWSGWRSRQRSGHPFSISAVKKRNGGAVLPYGL